jgi:hypothetical protein
MMTTALHHCQTLCQQLAMTIQFMQNRRDLTIEHNV